MSLPEQGFQRPNSTPLLTMIISKDSVVSMTYVVKDGDGETLDESSDTPMIYLHGHGNIVPGLEQALEGLEVGASVEVAVPPALGYGEYDPKKKFEMPTEGLGNNLPPIGATVELENEQGLTFSAQVVARNPESLTLDANHPLAGETLYFDVTVTELRAAQPEELAHGHVHGPGGHHH